MSSEEDEEDGEGEEGDKEFTWSGLIEAYEPVGHGVAGYPNGDTFEGNYLGGKRHSVGKYTFTKAGAVYEGNYTNNQKAGYGTMTYPDKSIYTGTWYQDTRSGEGRYTYANGDIYKGGWSENKKHGVGTYFFRNTMAQFIGDWEKGFFVKGKWQFCNGDFYEGDFAKSKPQGPGKFMFFRSKSTVTGTFEKDWEWTRLLTCEAIRHFSGEHHDSLNLTPMSHMKKATYYDTVLNEDLPDKYSRHSPQHSCSHNTVVEV